MVYLAISAALFTAILITAAIISKRITLLAEQFNARRDELFRLEETMKQEFSESRRESRETVSEFRRELNESFNNFQQILLNRLAEDSNMQNRQLEQLKTVLVNFAEKHVNKSNEFKEAVLASLQTANEAVNNKQDAFREKTAEKLDSVAEGIRRDAKENRNELNGSLQLFGANLSENIKNFNELLRTEFSNFGKQQAEMNAQAQAGVIELRDAVEKQLRSIRDDNTQQLAEMRKTVEEKLQTSLEKRLGESFRQVSDRLEQVHKGLGEMQTLAAGVGDLKKVLANVKTRGILGEYQLGNILEQMLSPEQYATNVATKAESQAHVEFAVKLPGKADEKTVWLPIDSKFPLESYQILLQSYEEAEPVKIEQAQKTLRRAVESFAKDISAKYIDPPNTTDFAIMFLPVESLFAEVLRHPQLFELLQRQYRITVTGPTTLSALLSSLSMGFRTLAVQKRSSEVWKVLAEVKKEFGNYSEQLALVHKQLSTASSSLEKLQETRTRALERKLREVTVLQHEDEAVRELAD
jgi:DNA recombination protein RmuC